MAKGPCPNCKQTITVVKGQTTVVCEHCGTSYRVVTEGGKRRLRPMKPKALSKPKSSKPIARVEPAPASQERVVIVQQPEPQRQGPNCFHLGTLVLIAWITMIACLVVTMTLASASHVNSETINMVETMAAETGDESWNDSAGFTALGVGIGSTAILLPTFCIWFAAFIVLGIVALITKPSGNVTFKTTPALIAGGVMLFSCILTGIGVIVSLNAPSNIDQMVDEINQTLTANTAIVATATESVVTLPPTWTPAQRNNVSPTRTPAPTSEASGDAPAGSRANPIPLDDGLLIKDWGILIVVGFLRGETANQAVEEANMFNSPPKTEYEYALVGMSALCKKTSDACNVDWELSYDLVSAGGSVYPEEMFQVIPEEFSFSGEFYAGDESKNGMLLFQVKKSDSDDFLLRVRTLSGAEGFMVIPPPSDYQGR